MHWFGPAAPIRKYFDDDDSAGRFRAATRERLGARSPKQRRPLKPYPLLHSARMNGGAHRDRFPTGPAADIFRLDHFVIALRIHFPQGRPEKRSPAVRIAYLEVSIPPCFRLWWLGAELIAPNVQHQPRLTESATPIPFSMIKLLSDSAIRAQVRRRSACSC